MRIARNVLDISIAILDNRTCPNFGTMRAKKCFPERQAGLTVKEERLDLLADDKLISEKETLYHF